MTVPNKPVYVRDLQHPSRSASPSGDSLPRPLNAPAPTPESVEFKRGAPTLGQVDPMRGTQPFELGSLLAHRKLILVCMVLAGVLGGLFGWFKPEQFTATATILLAGGAQETAVISARGDLTTYSVKMTQLAARSARLESERSGVDQVAFPPELEAAAKEPGVKTLLDGERLLFSARRRALEESLEKLRQERELAEQQVTSLQEQVRLAAVQEQSIQTEVEGVQSLVDRKLAPAPRLLDLQRTAAVIASRKVEIESELLRTRQNINQTEQRVAEVRNKRDAEVLAELQEVQAEISDTQSRRETSRSIASSGGLDQRFDSGMLANQADIITSDAVARETVSRLGLYREQAFLGDIPSDASEADRVEAAVKRLQDGLGAARVGPGSKIDVSFRSEEPARSALIANTVVEVYLDTEAKPARAAATEGDDSAGQATQVIRTATPPRRHDGPGLIGIVAAALTLGLIFGTGMAVLLDLFRTRPRTARSRRRGAIADGSPGR